MTQHVQVSWRMLSSLLQQNVEQLNEGQQGEELNEGQQGEQLNEGQQGEQLNEGQQGEQLNEGQQGGEQVRARRQAGGRKQGAAMHVLIGPLLSHPSFLLPPFLPSHFHRCMAALAPSLLSLSPSPPSVSFHF